MYDKYIGDLLIQEIIFILYYCIICIGDTLINCMLFSL